ncbi:unnamed protein product [Ectocarpus sp. CCAP 1310/34]|nr:unnamed protein product [Ectocarpus sp. CCAP 1310/34]
MGQECLYPGDRLIIQLWGARSRTCTSDDRPSFPAVSSRKPLEGERGEGGWDRSLATPELRQTAPCKV